MRLVLQTPSLEHLAGVKIVTRLWNQRDILTQIVQIFKDLSIYEERKEWKPIQDQVRSKVSALSLPQLCKHRLLNLVKPLGVEIIGWCSYHRGKNKLNVLGELLPPPFCWTMHGTVDYAKTAQLIVKDERVTMHRRLEFACINGLVDEARELILLLPAERRQEYYRSTLRNALRDDFYYLLVLFSSAIIADGFNPIILPVINIKKLFEDALRSGNRGMCEYLFKKLNQGEKEQVLENLGFNIATCSLLYYWSLMNEEQQERGFRQRSRFVLECLVDWPLQSLLMEAAKFGWQFLNKSDCHGMLSAILSKISLGFRDYDYSRLFWECWRLASADYKQSYLNEFWCLRSLLRTGRGEFLHLVLNEAPSQQILALCDRYHEISRVVTDESSISDSTLRKCKEKAVLISSNDKEDVEKRVRSKLVSRLMNLMMEEKKLKDCRCIFQAYLILSLF